MKKYVLIISLFCLGIMGVNAQNDIYYIPSKEVKEVKKVSPSKTTTHYQYEEPTTIDYSDVTVPSKRIDVDTYNRRRPAVEVEDTVAYDESSRVEDNNMDNFSYSKMIIRFHTPGGVIVSSPYYWDICYGNTWDVYYDNWALFLPSWSYWSYAYDPWYYNRWYYRTCWDYTWGWYDPWWGAHYWGWHHPVYWGWNRPCYGGWGYAHHHFHGASWGHGYAPGFHTMAGGGRDHFASTTNSVRSGSAGGFVRQGGNNYRSLQTNSGTTGSRSFASSNTGLSKSFRVSPQSGSTTTRTLRSSGGGFVRNGGTTNRTTTTRNYTTNRTQTQTPSNTYQRQPVQSSSSSRSSSFGSGVSTSRSSGGTISSGGGSSRSGGGGFSRSGVGRR